jgi:hypothetical protein
VYVYVCGYQYSIYRHAHTSVLWDCIDIIQKRNLIAFCAEKKHFSSFGSAKINFSIVTLIFALRFGFPFDKGVKEARNFNIF